MRQARQILSAGKHPYYQARARAALGAAKVKGFRPRELKTLAFIPSEDEVATFASRLLPGSARRTQTPH